MKDKKNFDNFFIFPDIKRHRLSLLLFLVVLTTPLLLWHNLFWYDNIVLFKYVLVFYVSAILTFALVGYSFLYFGLALIIGGSLGLVTGYFLGHLVNLLYPIQDGPGMAPNFTDIFRLFIGCFIGFTAGQFTAALVIYWRRHKKYNAQQVTQRDTDLSAMSAGRQR